MTLTFILSKTWTPADHAMPICEPSPSVLFLYGICNGLLKIPISVKPIPQTAPNARDMGISWREQAPILVMLDFLKHLYEWTVSLYFCDKPGQAGHVTPDNSEGHLEHYYLAPNYCMASKWLYSNIPTNQDSFPANSLNLMQHVGHRQNNSLM